MGDYLAVQGGLVWSGDQEQFVPGTVVIESDRIRDVLPPGESVDANENLDAAGLRVLPGLIDSHIHLCIPFHPDDPEGNSPQVTARSLAHAAMNGLANARTLIRNGITTIRDVGSHGHSIFAVRDAIRSGRAVGPRIFASGQAIAMTGGHGLMLATQADGVDGVRRAVRSELAAGADGIKLMASGSGAAAGEEPHDVHFDADELTVAVEVARGLQKFSAAHATNPTSIQHAVLAGVDSIEHGILADAACMTAMRERDVTLVPTVWAYRFVGARARYLNTPEHVAVEVRARWDAHQEIVWQAREESVRIAAGTDAAMPLNPERCLVWELRWLVECGLSPNEAIRAATVNGARLVSQDDLGRIGPGMRADIITVEGDPLIDVGALTRVNHVIRDGKFVVRNGRIIQRDPVIDTSPIPSGPTPNE